MRNFKWEVKWFVFEIINGCQKLIHIAICNGEQVSLTMTLSKSPISNVTTIITLMTAILIMMIMSKMMGVGGWSGSLRR